jgi:hypothetical protein
MDELSDYELALLNVSAKNILKKAQDQNAYYKAIGDLKSSLIDNLSKEFSGSKQFETSRGKEASPNQNDLVSLDNLLGFLASNIVNYTNPYAQLVFQKLDESNIDQLTEVEKGLYSSGAYKKYKTRTVYVEGFKQYLLKLRKDAIDSKNNLFILYVGKIISEANAAFGLSIPAMNEKEAPELTADISSEQIFDYIPKVFNLANPTKNGSDLAINVKNLKNPEDFESFVKTMYIFTGEGKEPRVPAEEDYCLILSGLVQRANTKPSINFQTQSGKIARYYRDLLKNLQKAFACPVTPTNTKEEGAGAKDHSSSTSDSKPGEKVSTKVKNILERYNTGGRFPYPFEEDGFDFNLIKNFLGVTREILSIPELSQGLGTLLGTFSSQASRVETYMNRIIKDIGSEYLNYSITNVDNNAAKLKGLTSSGAAGAAGIVINLNDMVAMLRNLVQIFYKYEQDQLNNVLINKNIIKQQLTLADNYTQAFQTYLSLYGK